MAKYSFILSTQYRVSFLIQLFVELGYQVAFVIFINVIYSSIPEIVGWSYYELLLLTGVNIVVTQIMLAVVFIDALWELPRMVKDGDFDLVLTQPVSALFYMSLREPYFTGLLSTLSGFFITFYSISNLNLEFDFVRIAVSVVTLILGMIIMYSVSVVLISLSFKFTANKIYSRGISRLIFYYSDKPHQVFQGIVRIFFTFVFPALIFTPIPVYIFLTGENMWEYLLIAFCLCSIFFVFMKKFWNKMVREYSSAEH